MQPWTRTFEEPELEELSRSWDARFPTIEPVGWMLRAWLADRWVRFHSLPGSKRYADTDAEYREILRRHHTVLRELGSAVELIAFAAVFEDGDEAVPGLPAGAPVWRTLSSPGEDGYWLGDLHLKLHRFEPACAELDLLLVAVADDTVGGPVVLAAPALTWLYHPYDGGGDVIAATPEARDELRERHRGWLSSHPAGL